jgi:propionate CoA-transferase
MVKFLEAEEAIALIPNGATLGLAATGPVLAADLLLNALEKSFLSKGAPRDLTVFSPWLPGDAVGEGGLNCIAHEGLLRKMIGATYSLSRHPRLIDLLLSGKVESYTMGMGTAVQLSAAIAAGKPGHFTTVGIGSFLDPRVEGGCVNAISKNPPVRVEVIDGKEWLFHPSFPIDVCIIRATTADENGYLSFEEEPNTLGVVQMAAAVRASGGTVIAQVKRVARAHSLDPRSVRVPGALVDVVVVDPEQTQLSRQFADPLHGWSPFYAGALKMPFNKQKPLEQGIERLILRRAAQELRAGDIVNLGGGMPTHMPRIALEEGALNDVVFTNEHGIFGGLMGITQGSFVPAMNPDAIMDALFQFSFYESGGLDITFLGMGQTDRHGNVNVSKFGKMLNGPGGFNSITEKTKRIVFCGSLTAGGLKVQEEDGRVRIVNEGRQKKFVPDVEQITLNGPRAFAQGQEVTYITERALFRLTADGPELAEIAPGIDVESEVKAQVAFPFKVSPNLKTMDANLYGPALMGLKQRLSA